MVAARVDRRLLSGASGPRGRGSRPPSPTRGRRRRAARRSPSRCGRTPCCAAPPRRARCSRRAPWPAASANSGSSSIIRGTSRGPISVATSSACLTSMSATGSPETVRRLNDAIRAPIRSRASSRPVRAGLTPTPRRISSDPGEERRGDDQRRGRREVAGDIDLVELRAARRARREIAASAPSPPHARRAQHPLGVVARRDRLDDRRPAVGVEPREQDARLHLCARHGGLVLDSGERPPLDCSSAAARRSSSTLRAHLGERRRYPVHRPRAERVVARQLEPALPPGRRAEPGSRRASVPALPQSIGRGRLAESASPTPARARHRPSFVHRHAKGAQRSERRLGVERASEAADERLALAHSAHEERAVGDRLVARHARAPREGRRPARCPSARARDRPGRAAPARPLLVRPRRRH